MKEIEQLDVKIDLVAETPQRHINTKRTFTFLLSGIISVFLP